MILYKIYLRKKMISWGKKGGYKHQIELPIKQYPLGRSEHLSLVTCVSSEVH